MANISENWDVGEYSHKAVLEEVELGGSGVTYAPGDVLKFTGVNAAGQMIAQKITAVDQPRAVVAKGQGGSSGEIKACVVSGDVVLKVGGAIPAGEGIAVLAGKIVKVSTGNSVNPCGFARGATTADGDTVLCCFKPGY